MVSCRLLVLPLLSAVLLAQQGAWSLIPGDPAPPRWTVGMLAYDAARSRCVQVNGSDVWESDGTAWQFIASFPNTGGQGGAFAYDWTRRRCLFFGGQLFFGNTLSEWDGTVWRVIPTANAPSPRSNTAMSYDLARSRMVLFGGWTGPSTLADTWEFDGVNWQQVLPSGAPPAMRGHRMVYDVARAETLAYSSANPTASWLYDGVTWRPTPVAPPALSLPTMVYDEARARTVLVGNVGLGATSSATWLWDGATWTNAQPSGGPLVSANSGAYDRLRQAVVVPGGGFDGLATWAWTGVQWERASPFGALPTLSGIAACWHPASNTAIAFGGAQGYGSGTNETLAYRRGGWRVLAPSARPAARGHSALALDPVSGDLLLMGGATTTALGDTWSWNGSTWTQLAPATSPPARGQHAMATDLARSRVVLFGGQDTVGSLHGDTWEWDGTNWIQATPANSPPPRPNPAMTYDQTRGRTLMFGGGNPTVPFRDDLWQWDGVNWTQRVVAVRPAPRGNGRFVFDWRNNRAVLAGGFVYSILGTNIAVADTWVWDDVQWTPVTGSSPVYTPDGVGVRHEELAGMLYSAPAGFVTLPSDHLFLVGSVAAVSAYGAGCPGATGTPQLTAVGVPQAGNSQFAVWLARARAGAFAFVGFDWQSAAIPLGGGCQALVATPVLVTTVANSLGGAVVPLPIPAVPSLHGLSLHGQAVTLDPAGALSGVAAMTAGLRLVLN